MIGANGNYDDDALDDALDDDDDDGRRRRFVFSSSSSKASMATVDGVRATAIRMRDNEWLSMRAIRDRGVVGVGSARRIHRRRRGARFEFAFIDATSIARIDERASARARYRRW